MTTPKSKHTLKSALAISDWIVELRRDLHANPELAYGEVRTSKRIQEVLTELGIEYKTGFAGGTGVVAMLGAGEGPCVALRADMDALPIHEQSGAEFSSCKPGVMHACGHDTHMAMLLGAARILKQDEVNLPGQVKLVFQPAEEGGAGAKKMCDEGVLENPKVERMFGMHVWPQLPTGVVGLRDGAFLASATFFDIFVHGKGGHAAMPNLVVDPIVAASQIVTNLQSIVSRERDPFGSDVVSISAFNAGDAYNVIPPVAQLKGTVRSLSLEDQAANIQRIQDIAQAIGSAHRCRVEVNFPGTTYPPTVNDDRALAIARTAARGVVGDAGLVVNSPTMGGEDFSFYAQEVPSAFAALGIGNEAKGAIHSLHHPEFRVDEDALPIGAAMHAAFAMEALAELSQR